MLARRFGLALEHVPHIARHLHHLSRGTSPLIWIQGQNCTGCSVSLMDGQNFDPTNLAYHKLSLRYQPDLMAASGDVATGELEETEDEFKGRYVLVLEGAIPLAEAGAYCTFGTAATKKLLMGREVSADRSVADWLAELLPGAEAVIAVGTCSSFGGIPSANADVTGAVSLPEFVSRIDPEKRVVIVPGCPPHADWITGTLMDVLLWVTGVKEEPELDEMGRLERFYGSTIHDNCERRAAFEEKRFLTDWNSPEASEGLCLLKLGCRGPKTHGDCPLRAGEANWCIRVNSPCQGCTEPEFYKRLPHAVPKK